MQVSDPNNVKIYNLSAGKSLPEWLSDRKRRQLLKKNVDIRRRIELIQDFNMPGVSTSIKVSPDGDYVIATGIYKPRMKCFEVNNLSMKFERCFDSEVVAFQILSDDYSKLVFLQSDRYVEFHVAHGRYYRLRIPKFGRDLQYNYQNCDLYIVAAGPDIYRLNLERGQFLTSFVSEASEINRCAVNPVHNLLVCGTKEGKVEAWDPRVRSRVGMLDCAMNCVADSQLEGFPSVTAVKFKDSLTLGVGTATGHILLYDIRSNKPVFVKDHMYGLPIKDVEFHKTFGQDLVLSMDSSIVKIWDRNNGKLFTSVEAVNTEFNNLCLIPKTGMFFIANENNKMLTYYIPTMGPAPKWCNFLDSLTEELEENNVETVYDDYKFVTQKELDELGLDHLIGSNLLRAYMHGYFVDIRLFKKAKATVNPFAFEEYKKKKIREKVEEERSNRVILKQLPKVNKDLALKMMDKDMKTKYKKKGTTNLLTDDRFKALFENTDFQVDKTTEEYRLLNPAVSKLNKSRKKELKKQIEKLQFDEVNDELDGRASSDESDRDSSSDDDREWVKEVQAQHRMIRYENQQRDYQDRRNEQQDREAVRAATSTTPTTQPKFYEIREGEEFKGMRGGKIKRKNNATLGERVEQEVKTEVRMLGSVGSREITFSTSKEKPRDTKAEQQAKKHKLERRSLTRPARGLHSKAKPKFYMGKRVQ